MTPTRNTQPGFRITCKKGFHVTFANGWTVSVQFGPSNYSDNYDRVAGYKDEVWCGEKGSSCAEVAVWGPDGEYSVLNLGGDIVRGWQTPAAVLALMNGAANGDLASGKIPPEERSVKHARQSRAVARRAN